MEFLAVLWAAAPVGPSSEGLFVPTGCGASGRVLIVWGCRLIAARLPPPLCVPALLACLPACREKIVQGRVDKIAKEMSLMDQAFIKDTSLTVAVSWR